MVDGTVGLGGHARLLLERIGPDGRLLGVDRDDVALDQPKDVQKMVDRLIDTIPPSLAQGAPAPAAAPTAPPAQH